MRKLAIKVISIEMERVTQVQILDETSHFTSGLVALVFMAYQPVGYLMSNPHIYIYIYIIYIYIYMKIYMIWFL